MHLITSYSLYISEALFCPTSRTQIYEVDKNEPPLQDFAINNVKVKTLIFLFFTAPLNKMTGSY